uniref:Uncharacterized protein n=1 Tax=Rhizophora mucronata TaxID=61149 RepID=A0A2P2PXL5_RHIMU
MINHTLMIMIMLKLEPIYPRKLLLPCQTLFTVTLFSHMDIFIPS